MADFSIAPLDIFFIVILVFFIFRCMIKGFVSEFMAMISVVGGIYAGIVFSASLSAFLARFTNGSKWTQSVAFLIIFLSTYLTAKFLENLFHSFIEKIELKRLDRSLGLFWGILEGAAVIFVILFVLRIQPFLDYDKITAGSRAAEICGKLFFYFPNSISG